MIASIACLSTPPQEGAIEYSIVSMTTADAVIAYRCNRREIADAPPGRLFVMAFSCAPGVSCSFTAQSDANAQQGGPVQLPTKALLTMRMGSEFLQWMTFSPYLPGSGLTPPPCASGIIRLHFSSPIISIAPMSGGSVANGIVHLPLHMPMKKTAVFPLPTVPFRVGVKIGLSNDGIFQITGGDLRRIGVPLEAIPLRMFRLFCNNAEVPIHITNSQHARMQTNDTILFYGKFLRGTNSYFTQFSNTNVYWLTWGTDRPGMRVAVISGAQRRDARMYQPVQQLKELAVRDFRDTLHLEEDNDIRWLGNIDDVADIGESPDSAVDIDNWYWGFIGKDYSTDFTIRLPAATDNPDALARIRVCLMGLTSVPQVAFDHDLAMLLNNNPLGDTVHSLRWKGQTGYVYETGLFPSSSLKTDSNTITFLRKSTVSDISSLNWVEIEYVRSFIALGNKLWFKNHSEDTGDVYQFELLGFSKASIDLWDIGSHRLFTGCMIRSVSDKSSSSYSLVFQDSLISVNSYFAQTADNRRSPESMRLDTIAEGWDSLADADYIAVAPDSFLPLLRPLIEAHQKRGMSAAAVDIDDIYNTFSAGIRNPESIRSFLRHSVSSGKEKRPRYLLLCGDATHDLDKNRRERTIVPTHLSRVPGWGPSSDDDYFAALDDSRFPSLSVGRFPAQNRMELQTLVAKTVKYLSCPEPGPWRDNLLLLGGWERDFTVFNNTVCSQVIGPAMNIYRMDADSGSAYYKNEFHASKTIADYINAGVYAINFNGHGGGNIWSDSKFFGYEDLDNLYNGRWGKGGRLPFVFSFTCLTGFFESVFYRSLGEEFVRQVNGGAICFFGASAYTSKQANITMNRIMLDYAVNGTFESVGELIRLTKMNMLARFGRQYLPVVRQYNLLGDPALPWRLAPDSMKTAIADSSLQPGDSLIVNGSCPPLSSGNVKVTVFADNRKWDERTVSLIQGRFAESFRMKDSAATGSGLVRAYAWNDSQALRGSVFFSKDEIPVLNVSLSKSNAHFGDTVVVSCTYASPPDALNTAILCLYSIAPQVPVTVQGGEHSFALPMSPSDGGRWASGPLPLTYSGRVGDILFVKFRIVYSLGSAQVSDTSRTFSFNIEGRCDLLFQNSPLLPKWREDSLSVIINVLNAGNVPAPPFQTVIFYGTDAKADTIAMVTTHDSLMPGMTASMTIAVPDTQAKDGVAVTACLNPGRLFPEISNDNNCRTAVMNIAYGDMQSTSDSLFSPGRGLCIVPMRPFGERHRVFLFSGTHSVQRPLLTESSWVPLAGDSVCQFSLGIRPPLFPDDSLSWIFIRDTVSEAWKKAGAGAGAVSAFLYDSSFAAWKFAHGGWAPSQQPCIMNCAVFGPFALGVAEDVTAPQVRLIVDGREINFLDYAAKDKPLNILMSDPSGIVPSSIAIRSNGTALAKGDVSQVYKTESFRDITVTAYPRKQKAVDSLFVSVEDFAGNAKSSIFAYMPGEELRISFFSCHPNPFTAAVDRTGRTMQTIRFAFLLTDVARDVSLTIYTMGGRSIWNWRQSTGIIGYQEVEWDGKTGNGYRIANGTYYAKLTALNDQKKAVRKIRIAKLEGY